MTGKKEQAGASHILVPLHSKLGEKDKKELLKKYHITIRELPKIFATDAAISSLDVKQGDIIKITRKSPTAGETVFYRGVLNA
ncbi:DNA-directed RNA polymerase subunit H [Candidatus Woesearchaeota archaeon]|nr:DNA-directed RNA polymerase subunit H [Candidatus Woesearchaeota archaeon]